MFRCLFVVILVPFIVYGDEKSPTYPEPGSDIPGPFHTYNVTGRKKDKFHCLITEHDLNPVIMVVVRGVEVKENEGLKYLLLKLDSAIQRNLAIRLGGFVVFLSDTLKGVSPAKVDDVREQLEKKLREQFPELAKFDAKREELEKAITVLKENPEAAMAAENLTAEQVEEKVSKMEREVQAMYRMRRLTLALDTKSKLDKFKLDDQAEVIVLIYNKYRVVALHNLTREQLTEAKARELLQQARTQLGARPEQDK
jgi:hypothetical protein